MTRNQTATATGVKGKSGTTTGKNEKGEFNMKNINMEELVSMITKSVIATLSQAEAVPTKATTKKTTKATTKKTTKAVVAKVSKPNPVKEKIMREQEELAEKFRE